MKIKTIRNLTIILLLALSLLFTDLANVFQCTGFSSGRDVYASSKSKSASKKSSRKKKYVSRLWTVKKPIAHACGGIDEIHYTNSREALKTALSRKVKTVEIDFIFSSDDILLCAHDLSDKMTAEEFKKKKVKDNYTPMTAEEALTILASKKRYLIADTKERNHLSVYKELLSICEKNDISWYKDYIIPQIYSFKAYDKYRKTYKFKYGIFTVYKLVSRGMTDDKSFRKVARFCKKRKLVACCNKKFYTKSYAELFRKYRVAVAVHTVNSKKKANRLIKRGARYIFTDKLYSL